MGEETQERFEKFIREEATKQIFKDFVYYSLEEEEKQEKLEKQEPKYKSSQINHVKSSSVSLSNPHSEIIINDSEQSQQRVKPLERTNSSVSIEQKMNRFKKPPTSASTSSLLKQYRVNSNLSNNSTGSSINILKKGGMSSSSMNFNQS